MWFRPFWYFRPSYKPPNLFLSRVALLRRPWFYPLRMLWPWHLRPFPEQVTIVVEDIFRGSIDWGLLLVLAPVFKPMYSDLILMVIVRGSIPAKVGFWVGLIMFSYVRTPTKLTNAVSKTQFSGPKKGRFLPKIP